MCSLKAAAVWNRHNHVSFRSVCVTATHERSLSTQEEKKNMFAADRRHTHDGAHDPPPGKPEAVRSGRKKPPEKEHDVLYSADTDGRTVHIPGTQAENSTWHFPGAGLETGEMEHSRTDRQPRSLHSLSAAPAGRELSLTHIIGYTE
ncbi:hypothetical protein EYF80_037120 [Liparis tanakae]|uniref:Uncharacterized protein n=1 Tax=Liparis tanakae TaxID=230148 RepID=A0A4Z2GGX3_9TELE|nr:hypothetical protein EYF80_037120 [Liparis tanakae]